MNRVLAFSGRNLKELLRDPLSYIFCLGFPLVMLVIMSIVNQSIPPEAGMTIFNIVNLAGGIAMFGQSFIMLFTCLSVSKDRSGAFLTRLYASPMKSFDFIAGYTFPVLALSVIQSVITFAASMTAGAVMGTNTISAGGALMAVVVLIPGAVFFIAAGLLFGSLFNEKAAPGLCSIIISLASLLGCVWFDAEGAGGVMLGVCRALPFYHCVKAARMAAALKFSGIGIHILIVAAYAALFSVLASFVFFFRKHSAAAINTAAPARISAGYISRVSCGIIIGSTPSAPAGGMNCPANFIMISAAATDRIAARVSGSPALQHSRYLSKAPVRAQPVIISTVFTGFERALLCGSENSVNATRSGGAIQNCTPKCISGNTRTAAAPTLTIADIHLNLSGFASGTKSSFSHTPARSRMYCARQVRAVIVTADIG